VKQVALSLVATMSLWVSLVCAQTAPGPVPDQVLRQAVNRLKQQQWSAGKSPRRQRDASYLSGEEQPINAQIRAYNPCDTAGCTDGGGPGTPDADQFDSARSQAIGIQALAPGASRLTVDALGNAALNQILLNTGITANSTVTYATLNLIEPSVGKAYVDGVDDATTKAALNFQQLDAMGTQAKLQPGSQEVVQRMAGCIAERMSANPPVSSEDALFECTGDTITPQPQTVASTTGTGPSLMDHPAARAMLAALSGPLPPELSNWELLLAPDYLGGTTGSSRYSDFTALVSQLQTFFGSFRYRIDAPTATAAVSAITREIPPSVSGQQWERTLYIEKFARLGSILQRRCKHANFVRQSGTIPSLTPENLDFWSTTRPDLEVTDAMLQDLSLLGAPTPPAFVDALWRIALPRLPLLTNNRFDCSVLGPSWDGSVTTLSYTAWDGFMQTLSTNFRTTTRLHEVWTEFTSRVAKAFLLEQVAIAEDRVRRVNMPDGDDSDLKGRSLNLIHKRYGEGVWSELERLVRSTRTWQGEISTAVGNELQAQGAAQYAIGMRQGEAASQRGPQRLGGAQ